MMPASIIHIITTIVIFKNELIDRLGTVHNLIDQRFPQNVFKWACRVISHSDTDSSILLIILDIIPSEKQIIFAIRPNNRRSP